MHDKLCDPFYRRLFVETAKRAQPDKIILNGDTFEMYEFSRYNKDPRKVDIVGAIKWVQELLRDLREAAPHAEITLIEGNHDCVTLDTDVLTENGFMNVADFVDSENIKIASYDGSKLNYSLPIAKTLTEPKKINRISTALTEETVSDGHNLYLNGRLSPFNKLNCSDFDNLSYKDFTTSVNTNKDLPNLIDTDYVSLMVQIVTDATLVYVNGKVKRIQWKLSKQRKIDRLTELLTRNNVPFTLRPATKGGVNILQPYYICVYSLAARDLLSKCLLTSKQFPRDIVKLNNEQFKVFIGELALTDGSLHYNHMAWTTVSKEDADLVAEVAFFNGVSTRTKTKSNASGFNAASCKLQYKQTIYYGKYEGKKYCEAAPAGVEVTAAIQTIDGTIITRVNGKIQVTGNCRLVKYMYEISPTLVPVLQELHGLDFPRLVGLDKYEVNYVGKSSLAYHSETDLKKEIKKNYYLAYDTVLFHHFPYAKDWGYAGVNGHHHKHIVSHMFDAKKGPYEWHQLGCGHVRQAEYCEGEVWSNGFILCHVDTHKQYTQFEYIDCTGESCVLGGKMYLRNPNEIIKL